MIVLLVAALVFGVVGLLAARRPLLARMAGREVIRRRGQSLLVIGGLMIGAAAITASLVGAESSRDSFLADAYRSWGYVDLAADAGSAFFTTDLVDRLSAEAGSSASSIDGVMGAVQVVGSAADLTRRQAESAVTVIGFDPARQGPFGAYVLTSGASTLGDDLGQGGVLLSRGLAEQLRARPGDRLTVQAEQGPGAGTPVPLRVSGIARSEGPGALGLRPTVFAPLPLAQRIVGITAINSVWVSAGGGVMNGLSSAGAAAREVQRAIRDSRSTAPLRLRHVKRDSVRQAEEGTEFLRTMLLAMSSLIVAAGGALVVNLTMMLAEERRPRLGVLRALGLTRWKLIQMSVIEGAIYSLAAALVGTAIGALAGRVVAGRFASAFTEFFGGTADFHFEFSLSWGTLAVSFAAGALITLLTVAVASRRTSRMSIPAAIRDLPEPAPVRRHPVARRVAMALLALAGGGLLLLPSRLSRLLGGVLVIMAISMLAKPRLSPRAHASVIGGLLAGWAFAMTATLTDPGGDTSEFFAVFTLSVLIAVFGLSILTSANLQLAEKGAAVLGRASTTVSRNLRAPLAYLARRPMRTGLTAGMFAVIMAILAMFSVFLFSFRPQYERDSAGYDIRLTSTGASTIALPASARPALRRVQELPTLGYLGPVETEQFSSESSFIPLYMLDARAGPRQPVRLQQIDERFQDEEAVWEALFANPRYVVSDFAQAGEKITLSTPSGKATYEVIASQQPGILDGIMGSPEALAGFGGIPRGATVLVDAKDGQDPSSLAHRMESSLFSAAVDAQTSRSLLDKHYRANTTFFSIIEILMKMGLVVGILSLGILGLRAVVERRHVIGVLRAIGYRKRGVMGGLMSEAGVTASLGVIVGVIAGLVMGFLFIRDQSGGVFGVDVASLGSSLALVYVAVLLVTIGPAWRASRLPPAEAVRYTE